MLGLVQIKIRADNYNASYLSYHISLIRNHNLCKYGGCCFEERSIKNGVANTKNSIKQSLRYAH